MKELTTLEEFYIVSSVSGFFNKEELKIIFDIDLIEGVWEYGKYKIKKLI